MKDKFEDNFDHILEQPAFTEEGFLNEACMNELSAVIDNFPIVHERCANDPEWSTPVWTNYRHITGALAYWAVRQINSYSDIETYELRDNDILPHPPNLEKIIGYVQSCIRPLFDKFSLKKISLCDISKMLHDVLMEDTTFLQWNDHKIMGPYWLDLHALLCNVCITIRDERRENDRFDKKFEEEWAKDPNNPKNNLCDDCEDEH